MAKQQRRTPAQIARDRKVRAEFSDRPSLKKLQATQKFDGPIPQKEYLGIMELLASLKHAREEANLSLADVADRTGMDRAAISRLENGLTDNPTVVTLGRLARAIGKRLQIELVDE